MGASLFVTKLCIEKYWKAPLQSWYMLAVTCKSKSLSTYTQLLEELQFLPSDQESPIAISSPAGLQAPDENLSTQSMLLKLGNLSRLRGSSKLDIVEGEETTGTWKKKKQDINSSRIRSTKIHKFNMNSDHNFLQRNNFSCSILPIRHQDHNFLPIWTKSFQKTNS